MACPPPSPDPDDRDEKGPPSVFLQDFVDVDCGAPLVGELLAGGSGWLTPLAGAAGGDATSLFVRVGPQLLGDLVARTVRVRLGDPSARGEAVRVPIRWEDAQHPALFPVLDGDLEVAPLDDAQCRVVLYAAYRPPLRGVGRVIDEALLHRVAESTVRAFLRRAADALAAQATQRAVQEAPEQMARQVVQEVVQEAVQAAPEPPAAPALE